MSTNPASEAAVVSFIVCAIYVASVIERSVDMVWTGSMAAAPLRPMCLPIRCPSVKVRSVSIDFVPNPRLRFIPALCLRLPRGRTNRSSAALPLMAFLSTVTIQSVRFGQLPSCLEHNASDSVVALDRAVGVDTRFIEVIASASLHDDLHLYERIEPADH